MSVVRPDTIYALREALVRETGDYSLVGQDIDGNLDYSVDGGADYFIDQGMIKICDMAPWLMGDTEYAVEMAPGEYQVRLPRLSAIKYVRALDSAGNESVIDRKDDRWIRDFQKTSLSITTPGAPLYWARHPANYTSSGEELEASLSLQRLAKVEWFIARLTGINPDTPVTGVYAYATVGADSLAVTAKSPASMKVSVNAGAGFISEAPFTREAASDSDVMVAPVTLPRTDLICVNLSGAIAIVTGDESGTPSIPNTPTGDILIAYIHHRVGETSIKDTNDGTNGYIEDKRAFVNL